MGIIKKIFNMQRLVGLGLMAVFLLIYVWNPSQIEFARLKVFDWYVQAKPRPIPAAGTSPVTIIDIDDQSLETIGQWPWPRTALAKMTENAMKMGAVLMAFDIVFAEPDRLNPVSFAQSAVGLDDEMKAKLAALPTNDEMFAKTLSKSRVVLGQAGRPTETEGVKGPPAKKSVGVLKKHKQAPDPKRIVPSFPSLVRNLPILEKATLHRAAGHGMFSVTPAEDGVIRNVPSFFEHDGALFPALSIEILRVATGRKSVLAEVNIAGFNQVKVAKGISVHTDRNGNIWPYFSHHDKNKYVAARDLVNGTVDPSKIKGKMLILGTSAVGLRDIRTIPTERNIPGVEVHAQVIEAILQKQYLTRPNYADAAELAFLFFGGLIMIILVPWVGAKWTFFLFAVVSGGAGGTSWYLFDEHRLLLDAAYAVVAILMIYTSMTYLGYATEEANRRKTRAAFSKYLSPDMVSRVAENPSELKLGGEERELTLLFCDVRGFTPISELFDPQGLTALINKLLTPLTNQIMARQGTVDKYMGDCIMAFWNAPLDDENHARNGCLSALAMLADMDPLNDRLEQEAKEEGRKHLPLKVGLGLNSGPCVVGNMGSDQRFDYSVLGDTVNLAARLEGQSKGYGVRIVLGPSTAEQVTDLAILELDLIQVKGKTEAVQIFGLVGDDEMVKTEFFQGLKPKHDQMLALYKAQKWDESLAMARECRAFAKDAPFEIDGFYELYETRNADFKATPPVAPGEDWDGVFVATTK